MRFHACLLLFVFGSLNPQASAQVPSSTVPWMDLFDGQSLKGWSQICGTGHYRVERGCIVGTPGTTYPSSYLATKAQYSDFELEYEFRVAGGPLNGGVQIRSADRAHGTGRDVWGYQVEIDPKKRAWSAGIYEQGGRAWIADLSRNQAAREAYRGNRWNRVRVLARGARIQTWINGVAAADLVDSRRQSGFVALQVHAIAKAEPWQISWRKLRIRDLGAHGWVDLGGKDLGKDLGKTWESLGPIVCKRGPKGLILNLKASAEAPATMATKQPIASGDSLGLDFKIEQGALDFGFNLQKAHSALGDEGCEIVLHRSPGGGGLYDLKTGVLLAKWPTQALRKALKPRAWNRLELARNGSRLVISINHARLLMVNLETNPASGQIGFLMRPSHQSRIQLRNIGVLQKGHQK